MCHRFKVNGLEVNGWALRLGLGVGLRSALAGLTAALMVGCGGGTPTPGAQGEGGVAVAVGTLEAEPPAMIPPEGRQNASSSPVVFDRLRGGVWTANGDVGTLSYVDIDARRVVRETALGSAADVRSVALSPDAKWVAAVDRAGGAVALVDAESGEVRRTVTVGGHPRAAIWDAANPRWLYIAVESGGAVAVVDRMLGVVQSSIDVGRQPSGLAVSARARELYVTHRIDGKVTVVSLPEDVAVAEVPLADEPFVAMGVPSGKPFGFESLALTPDGTRAWIPHELLAPTHPFVFSQTLFPAISVVNLVVRAETPSDPNSATVEGRKNLFTAINLPGRTGQPEVLSQPCAVAIHPGALVAWALACGSEDLIKLDVNAGIATDLLRGLPGDHPVGLTLDDTGQRLFVVSDQSHTLATLDTANGSLIERTRVYGDPIPLVAHDPVDPDLRAGLALFFRANSSKGALATTGNNWMSCGGCHLDGFDSSNIGLVEALKPADPQKDAQLGHSELADHFSSAALANADLNPHDLLTALLDQGGLAPDRTGSNRAGEVDPGHPTPDALQMAQRLARVVARDLPAGPAWLASRGTPDSSFDSNVCGGCHAAEYAAWSSSVHAHAADDPMVLYGLRVERGTQGAQVGRLCAGCHDPINARRGDASFQGGRGVTCLGCHEVDGLVHAAGNGDLQATAYDWTRDHKARALASLDRLREPEFCGGCHQQFVPGTGLAVIGTLDEYHASSYVGQSRCVDCHMTKAAGVADHHFAGGNVYLGKMFGDAVLQQEQQKNLSLALSVAARRVPGGVLVTLKNQGAGHDFPTGVTDIREPWVELEARDAGGHVVARIGGPIAAGQALPPGAARLGTDIARSDGTTLFAHEITDAVTVPFDVRIPAREAQALFVPIDSPLPGSPSLDAVVYYRNVRLAYYLAATGGTDGLVDVEIARVTVP
ncbi:MAG: hypothetical protein M3O50_20890 [Myxococcota bacterium]|nr:hypothetical protein [Myxococcota bacterium]